MSVRKYVVCQFGENDARKYTYHQDVAAGEEPLKPGDVGQVVDTRTANGTKRVNVVSVGDQAPTFATKPVQRYVPPPQRDDELPEEIGDPDFPADHGDF